jgi:16S rRNA (uracil1498-N3)-methyltransferase
MIRLFIKKNNIHSNKLILSKEEFHHFNALRIKPKEKIELLVINKKILLIQVEKLTKTELFFTKISESPLPPPLYPQITLAQCLPKQDKFTEILKKCTELGVASFIPVLSSRVITKIDQKSTEKIHRWQKIILQASSQSKRAQLPTLENPLTFKDFLPYSQNKKFDLKIVFWEEASLQTSLKSILSTTKITNNIMALIGPEGGLSSEEIAALTQNGFITASLGPTILRTENAGFLACGLIQHLHPGNGPEGKKGLTD